MKQYKIPDAAYKALKWAGLIACPAIATFVGHAQRRCDRHDHQRCRGVHRRAHRVQRGNSQGGLAMDEEKTKDGQDGVGPEDICEPIEVK